MKKQKLSKLSIKKHKVASLYTKRNIKGGFNSLRVICQPETDYCYYLTQVIVTGVAQGPCYTGNQESACPQICR